MYLLGQYLGPFLADGPLAVFHLGDMALAYADGDVSRGTAHQVTVTDVDITHLREKLWMGSDEV